jgi:hypothetical protein
MPKSIYSKRGGVLRYRTISLGKNKYAHLGIVRKPGKRGGRTMIGKIYSKE